MNFSRTHLTGEIVFCFVMSILFCSLAYAQIDVLPNLTDDQSLVKTNDNFHRLQSRIRTAEDSITAIYPIDLSLYPTTVDGVLPVSAGGTGQTTSIAAMNSFLPNQAGHAGASLITDGSVYSWGSTSQYSYDLYSIISSAETERAYTGNTYTKVKEITLFGSGALRFSWDIKASATDHAYGKIYRNDVAVGTEKTTTDTSYVTVDDTVYGWSNGDKIQLYIKGAGATDVATIKSFKIYGTLCTIVTD